MLMSNLAPATSSRLSILEREIIAKKGMLTIAADQIILGACLFPA